MAEVLPLLKDPCWSNIYMRRPVDCCKAAFQTLFQGYRVNGQWAVAYYMVYFDCNS